MSLSLPPDKLSAARTFGSLLAPGSKVCLTTHVNPDGDGLGSEVGLAHLLRANGVTAPVANPTAPPERFQFLFEDLAGVDRSAEAVKELRKADAIVVLDI